VSRGDRNWFICTSYRFRLYRNDLTAEGAENAEGENTERNNSDATGFDITYLESALWEEGGNQAAADFPPLYKRFVF